MPVLARRPWRGIDRPTGRSGSIPLLVLTRQRQHNGPLMSPRRRSEPRLNDRRAEICRTAAQIFLVRGFDPTSVNDAARALGMTKAGLYHYFPSKEALLLEIMTFG